MNEFTVPVPIIASVIAGAVPLLLLTASRAGIIEKRRYFWGANIRYSRVDMSRKIPIYYPSDNIPMLLLVGFR